jgi:hypothetical protein
MLKARVENKVVHMHVRKHVAVLILNFDTGWWRMVSLRLRSLYSWGKSSVFPLNTRLGGLQSQSRRFKNLFYLILK